MIKRYQVVDDSVSGHCCFVATVVDTSRQSYGVPVSVCECFDGNEAERICNALNAAHEIEQAEMIRKAAWRPE